MDFFNDIFHNLALLEFYFLNIIYILLYIDFILSIFFQHSNILTRASHHWCLASNIVLVPIDAYITCPSQRMCFLITWKWPMPFSCINQSILCILNATSPCYIYQQSFRENYVWQTNKFRQKIDLYAHQCGFQKSRSTYMALLSLNDRRAI